jgi:hypothetical protein
MGSETLLSDCLHSNCHSISLRASELRLAKTGQSSYFKTARKA